MHYNDGYWIIEDKLDKIFINIKWQINFAKTFVPSDFVQSHPLVGQFQFTLVTNLYVI